MILPDGTTKPWSSEDLPLKDNIIYTLNDTIAMSKYICEEENKRILKEILANVD